MVLECQLKLRVQSLISLPYVRCLSMRDGLHFGADNLRLLSVDLGPRTLPPSRGIISSVAFLCTSGTFYEILMTGIYGEDDAEPSRCAEQISCQQRGGLKGSYGFFHPLNTEQATTGSVPNKANGLQQAKHCQVSSLPQCSSGHHWHGYRGTRLSGSRQRSSALGTHFALSGLHMGPARCSSSRLIVLVG